MNGIDSAKKKVARARKHLHALESSSIGYTGDETNLVVDESEGAKKLRFPNEPPIDIAILAGEIIYQLRSALDHLAFELVKSNPTGIALPNGWQRKCQFPLCLKVPTHGDPPVPYALPVPVSHFRKSLPGITTEVYALIQELQPYNGGNGAMQLGWIEQLANIDKHRHFHVVTPQAYQTEYVLSETADSELIRRVQHGAEIKPVLHELDEMEGAVYVQRGIISPFVSFEERALPHQLADLSIDNVLGLCVDAVDRLVIPKFEGLI